MGETWKAVIGYEGLYSVSDLGRVRSETRIVRRTDGRPHTVAGRIKKTPVDGKGYPRTALYDSAHPSGQTCLVHKLVMAAFVGLCPANMQICHNDGDRTNPALSNLRYDSPRENHFDTVAHGTHNNASKTHCKRGHAFTVENTHIPRGKQKARICKICKRTRDAARSRRLSPL